MFPKESRFSWLKIARNTNYGVVMNPSKHRIPTPFWVFTLKNNAIRPSLGILKDILWSYEFVFLAPLIFIILVLAGVYLILGGK